MRWSVRLRATVNAACIVGVVLVVASVVAIGLRHRALLREVDTRAQLRLADVATLAAKGQLPLTLAGAGDDGTVAQVVAKGHVIAQSAQVTGALPIVNFVPPGSHLSMRSVRHAPLIGSSSYRVAAQRVVTPNGPVVVYAAAPLEPVGDSLRALELTLLILAPAIVALVALSTWWQVGRALRPVEAIRREVEEISASALGRRVPEPVSGDEIERLARTMNSMLGRMERAVLRQRSFVSDAAHELRGPLAAIRTDVEVTAKHLSTADVATVLERIAGTSRQLENLVEDLLVLAAADEQSRPPTVDVDLDEIVIRQLEMARSIARVPISAPMIDAARLIGHRDQLQRVVANVLDNAQRHARSSVVVELRARNGVAELTVADDGPGVPHELRERVFDRFARADDARIRAQGGAGLGLAIARRIVEDHGGSIAFGDTLEGARVVVRLPLQRSDDEFTG